MKFMRKTNKKPEPRPVFVPSAGEYYRENHHNRRRAKLLAKLDSKIWQARDLDTGAKIRIAAKDLREKPYHAGWTRISAPEALGPDWGKVEIGDEAEAFGVFTQ